ncbi:hypothetical protein ACFFX1_52295 [Dactylosporangium sucinum]|uniref:Uncharacterized protein n=1 Tax=Dactylosporangium sucinum TaxID=1424081 RepID=A0A917WW95_9ACTN|nr:hypothetical protein [Dactylosporangium sucinum]GGM35594.1 hypothetical protein GCM10007977_041270 [Dactylosporangium sucinum]
MLRNVVHEHGEVQVVLMDSMSYVSGDDRGHFVVAGSNGGPAAGRAGLRHGCLGVALNDAGIGKEASGITGIALLDEYGIIGVAVSHESAEISNAADMWDNGVVSHVNRTAAAAGFAEGDRLQDAILGYLRSAPGTGARR